MSARGARHEAQQRGAKKYNTNTPCKRGHYAERETHSGQCVECRRLMERVRYAEDPEKHIMHSRKFRIGKEAILAKNAAIARLNETPQQRKIRLEKAKIKQREWRMKNPQHAGTKASKLKYKKANPSKVRADCVRRVLAKIRRTPSWVGSEEQFLIDEAYALAALRTKLFSFVWHVDHEIPLQGKLVSGLHVPENLRVIPGIINVRKHNKYTP